MHIFLLIRTYYFFCNYENSVFFALLLRYFLDIIRPIALISFSLYIEIVPYISFIVNCTCVYNIPISYPRVILFDFLVS